MSAWNCKMELVVVYLPKNTSYQYQHAYSNNKLVFFVHDIRDFPTITNAQAWQKIRNCILIMGKTTESCVEIVKVSHGTRSEVTTILGKNDAWDKPFVEKINAGDSIEIRFTDNKKRGTMNRFEMRQVHVNLKKGEIYRLGMDYYSHHEFTQYIYFQLDNIKMQSNFLTNKMLLPLVETVQSNNDCMEVLYKPYSRVGDSFARTIWKRGSDLTLEHDFKFMDGDVIEIRVVHNYVEGEEEDGVDKVENGDVSDECVVCLTRERDVVLRNCNHRCVCAMCYENILEQAKYNQQNNVDDDKIEPLCPMCRDPISGMCPVVMWDTNLYGAIKNVTSDMGDVSGLLANLRRYSV